MILLDGKSVAEKIRNNLGKKIEKIKKKTGETPGLATILVGADPASKIYVRIKHKACNEVGIDSREIRLPEDVSKEILIQEIEKLNHDKSIHGILLQLPLPPNLDPLEMMNKIDPKKDVDGFHPINAGNLLIGKENFIPCTPKGILTLFTEYDIEVKGKNIVIINHSNIVGKPLSLLLLNRNATITVCHEYTKDLKQFTKLADILIIGIGKAKFIKKEMIKKGVVIIDVGINRIEGKLYGDVDFEDVKEVVSSITPVPGGVGPMTVASLLENTFLAFKKLEITTSF
ncbi:MAG: bifunctional methylenetetrahydrofolate dehydrogenase/methenyltetrahydrofolate cyclohydrolase FolD [Candidatus Lokiarchaeota archaeon]|nr:bifunctional methylenetetrahydrofolate dehydrogenase/methenyltetrahydrofolate cyclohydrolase FolD [Candidatus Lokiarchaeota archaeon]